MQNPSHILKWAAHTNSSCITAFPGVTHALKPIKNLCCQGCWVRSKPQGWYSYFSLIVHLSQIGLLIGHIASSTQVFNWVQCVAHHRIPRGPELVRAAENWNRGLRSPEPTKLEVEDCVTEATDTVCGTATAVAISPHLKPPSAIHCKLALRRSTAAEFVETEWNRVVLEHCWRWWMSNKMRRCSETATNPLQIRLLHSEVLKEILCVAESIVIHKASQVLSIHPSTMSSMYTSIHP